MNPLHTFPATHASDSTTFWIGLIALIGGGIASYYLLKLKGQRENYNQRMLGAMLCFFVALLGAGTALFSYLSMQKMTAVKIYADRIETGYGTVALKDIRQITFEKSGRSSLIDPGRIANEKRILLISERSGKAHALPEEIYDVNAIMGVLQEMRKKKE